MRACVCFLCVRYGYLDEVPVEELGLRGVEEHVHPHVQDPERGEQAGHDAHEKEEDGPEGVVVRHVLFLCQERWLVD